MQGFIRKYEGKNGSSWQLFIPLGKDENGKRKQKVVTFHGTKEEAEKELRKLLTQIDNGNYIDPNKKITVSEFLDEWLESYNASKKLAPKTYNSYKRMIELHLKPELGKIQLRKLSPKNIQDYYKKAQKEGRKDNKKSKERTLSGNTLLHHHRLLHLALTSAVKWDYISRNIADKDRVDVPKKEKKKMPTLGPEKIGEALKELEGNYLYMPVYLAITTGMRAGEILGLQWKDVNLEEGSVTVSQVLQGNRKDGVFFKAPKTEDSIRCIQIGAEAIKSLQQHKVKQSKDKLSFGESYNKQWNLVCCLEDGTPINPGTLSSRWQALSEKLGLGVRFHDLRHSHATILLGQGIHAKIVSDRLGHSNIGITMDLYSHVMPTMQKEAANRLEDALFSGKAAK